MQERFNHLQGSVFIVRNMLCIIFHTLSKENAHTSSKFSTCLGRPQWLHIKNTWWPSW